MPSKKKQRFDIFDIAQQGSSSGSSCPGGPCLVAKNVGPENGLEKVLYKRRREILQGDNWVGGDGRMEFAAYQLRLSGANRESGWNGTPAPR